MADIDVSYITEALNGKIDMPNGASQGSVDFVVTYKTPTESDPTWYRVYKSGWVEQGGLYNRGSTATSFSATIHLLKTMINGAYNLNLTVRGMAGDHLGEFGINAENITTTSFELYYYTGSSGDGSQYVYWQVSGQGV